MYASATRNLSRIVYLELLFSLRIPASIVFVFLAPALLLMVLGNRYPEPQFIVTGLISLVTGFSTLQGVGQVAAGMRFGIWKTLQAAIHPDWLYLGGLLISRVLRTVAVTALLAVLALLAYGPWCQGSWTIHFLLVLLGSVTFACLGLFLAYLPKSPTLAGNLMNLCVLFMMIVSGIFFSPPPSLVWVSYLSPMTFLTELLRANAGGKGFEAGALATSLTVLAAWAVASAVLAYRLARSREDD